VQLFYKVIILGDTEFPAAGHDEGERLQREARDALEDSAAIAEPPGGPTTGAQFFGDESSHLTDAQQTRLVLLKKMFPTLVDWPNEVLLAESVGSLSTAHGNLEARNGRDHRPTLDTRLSHNYKDLASKEIRVPEGRDNLVDKLHGGRFLPGPLCALTAVWMEARKHVLERGLTQYAHYDVKTVGLGNRVSSKAWACLHDPGSVDLSINLFMNASAGPIKNGDSVPEGLENFKLALSVARTAQQMVTPWNFSITTIQLFLETTKFGQRQFTNQKEHVGQLAAFVNDSLLTNAKNWQLGQPFMDVAALTTQWAVITAGRPAAATAAAGGGRFQHWSEKRKRSPSPQKKQQGYKAGGDGGGRSGVCIRYNEERCPNSSDNCSYKGAKLRHVCNVSLPGGKRCERRHTRLQHR